MKGGKKRTLDGADPGQTLTVSQGGGWKSPTGGGGEKKDQKRGDKSYNK